MAPLNPVSREAMAGFDLEEAFEAFGGVVRAFRLERGLTQADLAARADLSSGYISRIERGKADPTYQCLLQLSRGLGISVSELITPATRQGMLRAEAKDAG